MSGKLILNLKRKRDERRARQHQPKDTGASDQDSGTIGLTLRQQSDVTSARKACESRKKVKLATTERAVPDRSTPKYDFLKEALLKVNALQAELAALDNNDDTHEEGYNSDSEVDEAALMAFEAEALGFAVCARETMMFLGAQGLTADNPLVMNLRNQLVGRCGPVPI